MSRHCPARLAVFFERLGPYHHARLKAASNALAIHALETSDVDLTYAWEIVTGETPFARTILFPGRAPATLGMAEIRLRTREILALVRPECIVLAGWADRFSLAALEWATQHGIPSVVMSESTAWDDRRQTWKEFVKRRLLGLTSAALVGGHPHADYIKQLGLANGLIFLGYDAVDNEYFATKATEARSRKAEVRSKHALPENYFLASARFVEKKNLLKLIEAYALYRVRTETERTWDLVLLGDGPMRSSISDLRCSLRLENCVHLPGFKQYHELPSYYGLANAFVHASTTEQWGLVVNEAMASGLPVLVSNRCGCARDLVQDGVNGFAFDPYDADELAQLMLRLSKREPETRFKMGLESTRIISQWGPDRFASGLVQAVHKALTDSRPRSSLFNRIFLKMVLWKK